MADDANVTIDTDAPLPVRDVFRREQHQGGLEKTVAKNAQPEREATE